MNKKLFYLTLGVAVIGMTGCSKKLGQFKSDFFTTVPTPLETVGENVPGTITGKIPAKFMVKNAKVTATPVITWTDGESAAQPVIFRWRKCACQRTGGELQGGRIHLHTLQCGLSGSHGKK